MGGKTVMKKKIVILTCIVVALGLIIALFEKPDRFESQKHTPLFPNLKSEEIGSIDIEYFVNKTRLEKGDKNQWWVMEKEIREEADSEKANNLIDILLGLEVGLLVSTNPDKQNELQVGNAGLKVTLFDTKGEKKGLLMIGKQGPNLFSTFVRKEGENEIYLVDEYLSGIVNVPFDAWKKKEVISPPSENTP